MSSAATGKERGRHGSQPFPAYPFGLAASAILFVVGLPCPSLLHIVAARRDHTVKLRSAKSCSDLARQVMVAGKGCGRTTLNQTSDPPYVLRQSLQRQSVHILDTDAKGHEDCSLEESSPLDSCQHSYSETAPEASLKWRYPWQSCRPLAFKSNTKQGMASRQK